MTRPLRILRLKRGLSLGSERFSRVLFELPIIFLGVLAAFLAENYRERREADANARQIYRGIVREIADHRRYLGLAVDSIHLGLARWDSAYAAGARPAPFVFRIWGSEYPPDGAWKAALSQGTELREPALLMTLSAYYNEQIGISDRYVRYATFIESNVLPFPGPGQSMFYDSASGDLKSEYRGNMDRLRELSEFWQVMLPWADSITRQLERTIEK